MIDRVPGTSTHAAASRPRIVVGVDGSDESVTALQAARAVADSVGGILEVVTVWQRPKGAAALESMLPDLALDAFARQDWAVAAAFGDARPPLRSEVAEGDPADVLVERSHGAHLLVLADQRPGHFAGRVLGAVGLDSVERAACDVLIARPRPAHPVRPRYARAH